MQKGDKQGITIYHKIAFCQQIIMQYMTYLEYFHTLMTCDMQDKQAASLCNCLLYVSVESWYTLLDSLENR